MQIPRDEAKPKNWISTERTKRTAPSAREPHTFLWLQEVGEVQCRTKGSASLTAECQAIAASTRQDDYSPWEGIKLRLGTCIVCMDIEEHYTDGELSDSSFTSLGTGRVRTSKEPSESEKGQCEKQIGPSCFYNCPVFAVKLSSAHASRLPTQNLHVLQTKFHQHVWGLKFLSVINYILAWLLSTLLSKDKTQ